MTATTRWSTAILLILVLMAIGCASGVDLTKIPISVSFPPPVPSAPPVVEQSKPMATIAFHVFDAVTKEPIPTAIATFEDETQLQANDDGYMSIVKELNTYQARITAEDYLPAVRNIILTGNRQFEVPLTSTKAPAVIVPPVVQPPVVVPPVVTPAPNPAEAAKDWSDEQWKQAFFALLKKHNAPRTWNVQTLNDTRADIEALGAEWQHDSAGTLRPRLYLPVPLGADPFSRAFDVVAPEGGPWTWIKR